VTDRWAQAEAERIQGNMIRVGRVTEVDAANGLAKLTVGGLETDWLPWGVHRAGGTRTASAPTVGEQRLLFSPYGDMAQGVIGQAIYQDDHPTPAATGDQEVTVFPDGTRVEYDAAANKLQIDVAGSALVVINCKQATVNADTSVTLNTPDTFCKGKLTVDGLLTYKGGLTGSGGSGASLTGPLNVNGNVTNTGTLTNNGKNVGSTHTHSGVTTGGGTTGAPT
jgi:phage baseplate assembly protein V